MTTPPPVSIDHRRARWVATSLGIATLGALAAAVATLDSDPAGTSRSHNGGRRDPLEATLRRCQTLGEAALADAACRAGWAEHRRRFLAREPRP